MSAAAWATAVRPKTLAAAVVPVAVGTAVAAVSGGAAWGPAFAALLGALLIQVGTNFANDVYDAEKGADTEDRIGPTRAVASGMLTPTQVKRGMAVVFGLAIGVGVYLTSVVGWEIFALGIVCILAGVAYTGGPFPLAYNGLGDVFVLVFFGFVAVAGTAYVQTGSIVTLALIAAVPVGTLATALLVVNNVRDQETDAAVGKRTLVVLLGRRFAFAEYATMLLAAFAVPAVLVAQGHSRYVLLPWLTAPLAIRLFGRLRRESGEALNDVLAGTAKLLLVFGVLFAVGLAAGGA
jgi:1,4-dihydroxy-2-naphthoate octaprenyltransferase